MTLQAAWHIGSVFHLLYGVCELNLVVYSQLYKFSRKVVRAFSIFCPHEGFRTVTALDAVRVNRKPIFHESPSLVDTSFGPRDIPRPVIIVSGVPPSSTGHGDTIFKNIQCSLFDYLLQAVFVVERIWVFCTRTSL